MIVQDEFFYSPRQNILRKSMQKIALVVGAFVALYSGVVNILTRTAFHSHNVIRGCLMHFLKVVNKFLSFFCRCIGNSLQLFWIKNFL